LIYQLTIPGPIEDVEEVRVLEWHGVENHAFEPGDLMVELETHKALIEIRAGQRGILRSILCFQSEWGKIGRPLAILSDTADEALPGSDEGLVAWEATFEIT
jgi:pyruvate/2-oxoglutarate dehydrogenase complex dihydrolipoamide acyltransferase (E2) component